MPTKKELENKITELESQVRELQESLNESTKLTDDAIEVIYTWKKAYKLSKDRITELENKSYETREFTNWERCLIRDSEMLKHFYELLDNEEDPNRYGILKPLRYQTYDWALNQGYFTNLKEPLSYRQLTSILPKPEK